MGPILKALLGALFGAFGDVFLGWARERRAEKAMREAGALAASLATAQTTSEIANARAKIAGRDDDVDAVAERLRVKSIERDRESGR